MIDKLRLILAIIRYVPEVVKAIEPLFGKGMSKQKRDLATNIITLAATGGDFIGVIIDATVASLNENNGWQDGTGEPGK